jgi:hypothetical protein
MVGLICFTRGLKINGVQYCILLGWITSLELAGCLFYYGAFLH